MTASAQLPEQIQKALKGGVLTRMPITFLPFVHQQLNQWQYLFPNERNSVERLLLYVARLNDAQSALLFRDVVDLEEKMGVRHWQFSTTEQTIQNSSQLARSPYFLEWRRAVQAVFDAADRDADQNSGASSKPARRLILLEIPGNLPLNAASVWRRWDNIGKPVKLDLAVAAPGAGSMASLLTGVDASSQGLLQTAHTRPAAAYADTWVIDAGQGLVDSLARQDGAAALAPVLLSYERLDPCRQQFSHQMNSMRKDLADADAVFDTLRNVDISPWCPPEVAADPAVREFVRSLYLSGNGAVIFGNSFVEWASSEALRRARPLLLVARFGVRSKPKPFTGVAVFDNPDQINPLPAVDDLEGSATDAQMLALYIWLAAARYEEYQHFTVCVCIAESLSEAYVIAPPEFTLPQAPEPVSVMQLLQALRNWIA